MILSHRFRLLSSALCLLPLSFACGGEEEPPPNLPTDGGAPDGGAPADAGTLSIRVTHTATQPFAMSSADVAWAADDLAVVATPRGIAPIAVSGANAGTIPTGWMEWVLTSSSAGTGAAATGVVVVPEGKLPGSGPHAFFLPSGQPQVGALVVRTAPTRQGGLISEGVLTSTLSTPYPSSIAAPRMGPAADALWVVDAPFSGNSFVRAYPYARYNMATKKLVEDATRRFTGAPADLDGDGRSEQLVLGRLAFSPTGEVGLVTFTIRAATAPGTTGGVLAFDAMTGAELGRVVVPNVSTATTTLGFAASVAASGDTLVITSNEIKAVGMGFEDVGGQIAVYSVTTWKPFVVVDRNATARYHQADHQLRTSSANPVGVALVAGHALVVDAPYFGIGALDVVRLSGDVRITKTTQLGMLYVMGFNAPLDPRLSADERVALIGTEAGAIRVELVRE